VTGAVAVAIDNWLPCQLYMGSSAAAAAAAAATVVNVGTCSLRVG